MFVKLLIGRRSSASQLNKETNIPSIGCEAVAFAWLLITPNFLGGRIARLPAFKLHRNEPYESIDDALK